MQQVAVSAPVTPRKEAPARYSGEADDEDGPQLTPRDSSRVSTAAKGKPAKHKVKHRKQKQGQTIFKGHPSWAIMNNIKLGIHHSVSRAYSNAADAERPLTLRDFSTELRQTFPPEGSSQTQAHGSEEFTFRDAAPLAFRHLREHFGVSAEDYMLSICGENNLRELGTPGKSGSVFYLTEDGRYMIKTVSRKESKFLRRILPNYYNYVMRSRATFIPKFLGLIRITTASHRRIRLVVFDNLLPMDYFIHEKFDLKGSTLGRWATEKERADPNVTLKDLDFDHKISLPPETHAAFRHQIEADTQWLRALLIMDYSLLVMLHFPGREPAFPGLEHLSESMPDMGGSSTRFTTIDEEGPGGGGGGGAYVYRGAPAASPGASPKALASTVESPHRRALAKTGFTAAAAAIDISDPAAPHAASPPRAASKSAQADAMEDDMDADAELDRLNLPRVNDADLAQAYATRMSYALHQQSNGGDGAGGSGGAAGGGGGSSCLPLPYWNATTASGENVLVFAGIIDILQIYGARKKLEHQYKSLVHFTEREGISVTNPASYATRLATFVLSKFILAPSADGAAAALAAAAPVPAEISRAGTVGALGEAPAVSGVVHKKGVHFPFSWSARYCELYGASKLLVYYHQLSEKTSGQPPRGQRSLVALADYGEQDSGLVLTVLTADTRRPSSASGRGSAAERSASHGGLTRPLQLRFFTRAERDAWRAALAAVLGEPKEASSAAPTAAEARASAAGSEGSTSPAGARAQRSDERSQSVSGQI